MNIKTVKMTKDQDGSPDGISVQTYAKGETYDLPAELADAFCKDIKCAKTHKRAAVKETPEDKAAVKETPEKPKK